MAETHENVPKSGNNSLLRTLQGGDPVLSFNESPVITDKEYIAQREKLMNRNKLDLLWSSSSRIFNWVATTLITAAMGLVVASFVGAAGASQTTAITTLFGLGAAFLVGGIATDYFENQVKGNNYFDDREIGWKRQAAAMGPAIAQAFKKEIEQGLSPSLSAEMEKLKERSSLSWEKKAGKDPETPSAPLRIG